MSVPLRDPMRGREFLREDVPVGEQRQLGIAQHAGVGAEAVRVVELEVEDTRDAG
jgi:hypothetical protein